MSQKTVYILHKNGAKNHYTGLDYLLQENNIQLKHREFSIFSKTIKSIFKLNFNLFYKQLINTAFFINLLFTKDKKVVLGIAPFDNKLSFVLFYLKRHKIYYHTSWTYWDKSFHPKTKKNSPKVFKEWQDFLEIKVTHIFAVTTQSKTQLQENYKLHENKISVVNHAIDKEFSQDIKSNRKRNSFIYLGRLVEQKGLEELLLFFSNHPAGSLTIIGKGKQEELVKKYADTHENISYHGHMSDKAALNKELGKHEYSLLNSKRNRKWEELFGLIIIESMAQGLIPIAPKHSGPKEIITEETGFLFEEGDVAQILSKILSFENFDETKSKNAVKQSMNYLPNAIAQKWLPILE
ncbi:glycosyltransferase [Aquimarina pacifica]|uniref:glycosyltransferase n=1 Tax=Aquimarina pacifica TaxID=1296415 RepID=UPI00046FD5DE|nr:glycosyltransferase [Aquimarina pacifica]